MFFYVSLVLVIVAAITLVIGLLNSGLPLVIVSIASSFLAGVFLILTVMRDRPRAEEPAVATIPASAAGAPPEPGAAEFPIADYDELKVSEIVPLLSELDDDELDMVREREEAAKARATILGRIDELMAEGEGEEPLAVEDEEFPIADYDELKVSEIVPLLPELDDDELEMVRDRERAGKSRASIVSSIDELLGEEAAPVATAASSRKPAPAKAAASKAGKSKAAPAKRAPAAGRAKPGATKPAATKAAPAKAAAPKGGGVPIAGYDTLSVADVTKALRKLDATQLKAVRTYEKRKKGRKGVLDKIDAELAAR